MAYLTFGSLEKPSIFDVIAQESLLENLHPAFEQIIKVLTKKYPRCLSWIYKNVDEIFYSFYAILQFHYLSNYGASFSENFYDLKRIPLKAKGKQDYTDNRKNPLKLKTLHFYKSLAILTVLPYLRHYLSKQYKRNIEEGVYGPNGLSEEEDRNKIPLKIKLLKLWPLIHFILETVTLIYYIRYILGHSKVQTPTLHVCGTLLSYLTEDEYEYIEKRSKQISDPSKIRSFGGFCRWSADIIGYCLQNSLEVGAFFIEFLDWFYSSDSAAALALSSNPIPPPPHETLSKEYQGICPLCCKEYKRETALTVSGYVFCYQCILPHIRNKGVCPVTGYPASTKQLVRLYRD